MYVHDDYSPLPATGKSTPATARRCAYSLLLICPVVICCTWVAVYTEEKVSSFRSDACQLTNDSRFNDKGTPFGSVVKTWYQPACQAHYTCVDPFFVLDRTCTQEDRTSGGLDPIPHEAPILVSHTYKTVYVANPTSADFMTSIIMVENLHAERHTSHSITKHMAEQYLFFTFVEEPQQRFFVAARQMLQGEPNASNCPAALQNMSQYLLPAGTGPAATIPSQTYLLSADSGKSNKMIKLHWIEKTERFAGGIIDVLLRIQNKARRCITPIDFDKLNYKTVQHQIQHSIETFALRKCGAHAMEHKIAERYRQDNVCTQ